jgi:hypothetical protein
MKLLLFLASAEELYGFGGLLLIVIILPVYEGAGRAILTLWFGAALHMIRRAHFISLSQSLNTRRSLLNNRLSA